MVGNLHKPILLYHHDYSYQIRHVGNQTTFLNITSLFIIYQQHKLTVTDFPLSRHKRHQFISISKPTQCSPYLNIHNKIFLLVDAFILESI